jgi:hypothetical protein
MSDYSNTTDGYNTNSVNGSTPPGISDSAYFDQYLMAEEAIVEAAKPIAMSISNVQSGATKKFMENAKKLAKKAADDLKQQG